MSTIIPFLIRIIIDLFIILIFVQTFKKEISTKFFEKELEKQKIIYFSNCVALDRKTFHSLILLAKFSGDTEKYKNTVDNSYPEEILNLLKLTPSQQD